MDDINCEVRLCQKIASNHYCDQCLKETKEESYDEGYEKGYEEGKRDATE